MKIKLTHKFHKLNTSPCIPGTTLYMAKASVYFNIQKGANCFLIVYVKEEEITKIKIRYTITPYLKELGLDNTSWEGDQRQNIIY